MLTSTEPTIIQLQPPATAQSVITQAVAIGRKHHVRFEVMPRIGVLEGPVEINGWLCVPRDQDTSFVPRKASKRVDWLREAGIPVMQEIIMHEPDTEHAEQGESATRATLNMGKVLGVAAVGVAAFAVVAAAAVVVSAISAVTATAAATATAAVATPTAVAVGAGVLALGLDPALVCVLEDGTWICVAEYYDV